MLAQIEAYQTGSSEQAIINIDSKLIQECIENLHLLQ